MNKRTLCVASLLIALSQPLAATSICPLSAQAGTSATAPTIDGVQGAGEWTDASQVLSSSPCFETLLDGDSVSKDVFVFSKTYTRGAAGFFGIFLKVNDSSTANSPSGDLVNGERIILQFDPDKSGGAGLTADDYKVRIVHKWKHSVPGPVIDPVDVTVFNGSGGTVVCGHATWSDITGTLTAAKKPNVVVRQLSGPTRYTVELEVPLELLGNPAGDMGVGLAVINDHGNCPGTGCFGSGASFPNDVPITTTDNPVNGCEDSWSVPDKWATGYRTNPPTDVWLTHMTAYWLSNDVDAFRCSVRDNAYYPMDPCKLRVEGCFNNSDTTLAQTRHLLFLRGRYAIGGPDWTVVELRKNVSLPANARTCLISNETTTGLVGLQGHPCVRVYVLPPAFKPEFDENRIMTIASELDLTTMAAVYQLHGNHSAQQNISRMAETAVCPEKACEVAAMAQPVVQIASLAPQLPEAWQPGGDRDEGDEGEVEDPPLVRNPGTNVLLAGEDLQRFGRDHVIVQVRGFGSGGTPPSDPRYTFLEEVGGIVQLIPVDQIQKLGRIPFRFEVGNPGREDKTIFLRLDVHVPPGMEEIEFLLDTAPKPYRPGDTRMLTAVVRKVGFFDTDDADSRFGLSLHAGINEPHGDFADIADGDKSWMVDFEYRLSSRFSLELLYGHHDFDGVGIFPDTEIKHVSLNAKLFFPGGFWRPFVNAGAGSYDVNPGLSDTGANAGFGVLHMFPSGLGVELGYNFHRVFASPDLDFSTLLAGLRWRF